jgi:hypothetical protein
MTHPFGPVLTAFYAAATADASLIGRLGGTAVYVGDVPAGTSPPYVVLSLVQGEDMNLCPSRIRTMRVSAKAVSLASKKEAEEIDALLDGDFHDQELDVAGWNNIWTARDRDVDYVERAQDGQTYYHAGGIYRVIIT